MSKVRDYSYIEEFGFHTNIRGATETCELDKISSSQS